MSIEMNSQMAQDLSTKIMSNTFSSEKESETKNRDSKTSSFSGNENMNDIYSNGKYISESFVDDKDELFEYAKNCPWKIARQLFDDEVARYVTLIQASLASNDWSSLKQIQVTVTRNSNNGKYCCWECGGARSLAGHSVIIGAPDGKRHLALTAFRRFKVSNGKHAVIQVWPSCVVTIASQSRGMGAVLLYRISDIKPMTSVYENQYVNRFVAVLELNKVINISTREVQVFSTDLDNITTESDIINAAIKKATIYNCQHAIYVRPFFLIKSDDANKQWNMDTVPVVDEYADETSVTNFFTDVLARLSELVRKMDTGVFPYVGVQVLTNTDDLSDDEKENCQTVKLKVAIFANDDCEGYNVVINSDIFYKFRDFFISKNFEAYKNLQFVENDWKKIAIFKYASN